MSWYATEEAATKVAKRKTKDYGEEFIVVKHSTIPYCYWTQKKSTCVNADLPPPTQANRDR